MANGKKENGSPQNLSALMDQTVNIMTRLRNLGGFGYVAFGAGFILCILIVAAPFLAVGAPTIELSNVTYRFIPVGITLMLLGFISVIVDKLMGFRLASVKLKMIVAVTEATVNRVLTPEPGETRLDTAVARMVIKEILAEIWGMKWKAENGGTITEN